MSQSRYHLSVPTDDTTMIIYFVIRFEFHYFYIIFDVRVYREVKCMCVLSKILFFYLYSSVYGFKRIMVNVDRVPISFFFRTVSITSGFFPDSFIRCKLRSLLFLLIIIVGPPLPSNVFGSANKWKITRGFRFPAVKFYDVERQFGSIIHRGFDPSKVAGGALERMEIYGHEKRFGKTPPWTTCDRPYIDWKRTNGNVPWTGSNM